MKLIKTKLLQDAKGRKQGRYLITLEVTDYDILMLEDLNFTYAPFDYHRFLDKNGQSKKIEIDMNVLDFIPKYRKWLMKLWHCFWKLWNKYDKM